MVARLVFLVFLLRILIFCVSVRCLRLLVVLREPMLLMDNTITKPTHNNVNKIIFVFAFFFSFQWITTSVSAPLSCRHCHAATAVATIVTTRQKLDENIFISVTNRQLIWKTISFSFSSCRLLCGADFVRSLSPSLAKTIFNYFIFEPSTWSIYVTSSLTARTAIMNGRANSCHMQSYIITSLS